MATGQDRFGRCETCQDWGRLRFLRSGSDTFGWICLRCQAKCGHHLEASEIDFLQAEQLDSERKLRASRAGEAGRGSTSPSVRPILVIEDDTDIRRTVCAVLEDEGFPTLQAANGREGLDLLATLDPLPCLILLDLWMPEMNGWDFHEHVSRDRRFRSLPIVVMSAYDGEMMVGSLKWLRKPLGIDDLLEAVRTTRGVVGSTRE